VQRPVLGNKRGGRGTYHFHHSLHTTSTISSPYLLTALTNTWLQKALATAPLAIHPQSLTPRLTGPLVSVFALIPRSVRLQLVLTPAMLGIPGTITPGMTSISGTLNSRLLSMQSVAASNGKPHKYISIYYTDTLLPYL
jgi:hypothetical protein